MRIVDLSTPIAHEFPTDPPIQMAHIKYVDHQDGIPSMLTAFPGITAKDLPGGCAWAVEEIALCTHTGTHMDAPWHYHPTMNGGERAWGIDEIPLEWCIGDGVVVDFSDRPDGYVTTPDDFKEYFKKVRYSLKPGDIVLIHTSAMEAWGISDYMKKGCGVGAEATKWLSHQGIRVTGTDAWSWDAPLSFIAEEVKKTGNKDLIWEGHKAGRDMIYCHMEKMNNLDKLPTYGFKVVALPINIEHASAGWVRPIAILGENEG